MHARQQADALVVPQRITYVSIPRPSLMAKPFLSMSSIYRFESAPSQAPRPRAPASDRAARPVWVLSPPSARRPRRGGALGPAHPTTKGRCPHGRPADDRTARGRSRRRARTCRFHEFEPSMFHTAATPRSAAASRGVSPTCPRARPAGRQLLHAAQRLSVIAWRVGTELPEDAYHFQIAASHADSPTFKVKAVAELEGPGEYLRLDVEPTGAPSTTAGSTARCRSPAAC